VVSLDSSDVRDLLAKWLPAQRWWPAKGHSVTLAPVGHLRLASPDPAVDVLTLFLTLTDTAGTHTGDVIQVPLTRRRTPAPDLEAALVGQLDGSGWVYDGTHDPAFVAAWVDLIAAEGEVPGTAEQPHTSARGVRPSGGLGVSPDRPSRVLRGEQSNTSIIIDGTDGTDGVIVKLFRVLRPGANPDVEVTTALAAGGCLRVPRPVGWVEGSWRDAHGAETLHGHLAYACEFLEGSEDAYRSASRAVAAGASFASEAAELGAATAEVHATLAVVLPSEPASPARLAALADHFHNRLRWAISAAPQIDQQRGAAEALIEQVRRLEVDPVTAPVWQRIHGDYHLGQVLHSPSRGWVLFDFEGEPLTPLAERSRPDLALRDVAGMLRSFDYAAQHETYQLPAGDPASIAAQRWFEQCRVAFLRAYREVAHGPDVAVSDWEPVLLRAFEVDKALYEVVYETRNRPDWVQRPMQGLSRLLRA
jgi:trehalose synthase-fused probable maltokinase